MWTRVMAAEWEENGSMVVAVNPGSLLASKDEFENVSGKYFDNDSGQFANPHSDGLDDQKCEAVVAAIEGCLHRLL